LNGTCNLLVCAEDVNKLRGNIYIIKQIAESILGATKEVGLAVKAEELRVCVYVVTKMHNIIRQ